LQRNDKAEREGMRREGFEEMVAMSRERRRTGVGRAERG
jgi:hypothetical protein